MTASSPSPESSHGETAGVPDRVIVIMAGGAGERFWPVSNRRTPKQLLHMRPRPGEPEQSLLAMAFDRARLVVPASRVFIVAGDKLTEAIERALPDLRPENIIIEPEARNTAPCLAFAAADIERRFGPRTVMGVLTADHLIDSGEAFKRTIRTAFDYAAHHDDLVTLGIEPTRPETGYGYLEIGEEVSPAATGVSDAAEPSATDASAQVYRVVKFTEKPDIETAENFVASGRYFWNSGMFFWRIETLFGAFEKYQPEMAHEIERLRASGHEGVSTRLISDVYSGLPALPIDVAIMEKAERVVAVRANFWWEDVGSWDALARVSETDEAGNIRIGPVIAVDAANNIIYNDSADAPAPQEVVLLGVEDLVIVRSERAVLVMRRDRAQQVKDVVRLLKESNREDLL